MIQHLITPQKISKRQKDRINIKYRYIYIPIEFINFLYKIVVW